eukprot:12778749-Heterocapsa_arctica.AAC.1
MLDAFSNASRFCAVKGATGRAAGSSCGLVAARAVARASPCAGREPIRALPAAENRKPAGASQPGPE